MDDPEEREPFCYTCISSAYWQECEELGCDDGWVESDWDEFNDDYPVERCDTCNGKGGWWICLGEAHHDLDRGSIHRIPLDQRPVTAAN